MQNFNRFRFVEYDAAEIRFYPRSEKYSVFDKHGLLIAEGVNQQDYIPFRMYCLNNDHLFAKCFDYVIEDNVFKSCKRWVDNPRVEAEAVPAPPKERESIWEAVRVGLYDYPKEVSVRIADRVSNALERDSPAIITVGTTRYHREDRISTKFIDEAKELRERSATLIRSLRSVVDEFEMRLRPGKEFRGKPETAKKRPRPKKPTEKKTKKTRKQ